MSEPYKYMSSDEIANFIIEHYERQNPMFDMDKSFKAGRLTDGLNPSFDVVSLIAIPKNSYLFWFAKDFFHSLNDKSPAATQFKERVLLLTKFYTPNFYKSPNAAAELTVFLERGIEIMHFGTMRRDFLRGMYKTAFGFNSLRAKISRKIADSPFAKSTDISAMIMENVAELTDDEMKHWLDSMEKLATVNITFELYKNVPDVARIAKIISDVNATCDIVVQNGRNFAEKCAEIKNKITLENMLKNVSKKSKVQDPKDKAIQDLQKLVQTLQNEKDDLQKLIAELRARDATRQKQLSQAAGKLKVGIGSRGVKNMKKLVSNISTQVKHK